MSFFEKLFHKSLSLQKTKLLGPFKLFYVYWVKSIKSSETKSSQKAQNSIKSLLYDCFQLNCLLFLASQSERINKAIISEISDRRAVLCLCRLEESPEIMPGSSKKTDRKNTKRNRVLMKQ
jgi:hypothetical protein